MKRQREDDIQHQALLPKRLESKSPRPGRFPPKEPVRRQLLKVDLGPDV